MALPERREGNATFGRQPEHAVLRICLQRLDDTQP
jgi:hypothetical protein